MYLQSIPLSVIGDRAHGEKSINGVNVVEKGPLTKDELNHIVDIASQKGITLTCKEMKYRNRHRETEDPTGQRRHILVQQLCGRRD